MALLPDGRLVVPDAMNGRAQLLGPGPGGVSSDYRIDLHLGDRVLRIERAFDPIPVPPAERDHYRDSITDMMRYMDPDWEWNGPPIPETKPVFRRLHSGRDGRIWVELSPALRSADDPSLGERIRYDVFEPDGAYLGAVNAPLEFKASVEPRLRRRPRLGRDPGRTRRPTGGPLPHRPLSSVCVRAGRPTVRGQTRASTRSGEDCVHGLP